jgi:hypothetical protein
MCKVNFRGYNWFEKNKNEVSANKKIYSIPYLAKGGYFRLF